MFTIISGSSFTSQPLTNSLIQLGGLCNFLSSDKLRTGTEQDIGYYREPSFATQHEGKWTGFFFFFLFRRQSKCKDRKLEIILAD